MKEALSYQRLLEITGKLPPDEQEYVFRFLSANERKLKLRLEELEKKRFFLEEKEQRWAEKKWAYQAKIAELHEALLRQKELCPKRDRAYRVLETLLLRAIRQTVVDDHTAKLLQLAIEDVREYLNLPEDVI